MNNIGKDFRTNKQIIFTYGRAPAITTSFNFYVFIHYWPTMCLDFMDKIASDILR